MSSITGIGTMYSKHGSRFGLSILLAACFTLSCSGTDNSSPTDTGGASSNGASSSVGGTGNGGTSTGGASSGGKSSGGTSSIGGAATTGGTPSSGGTTTVNGGSKATGGMLATGGSTAAAGGTPSTGGSKATGGAPATGGAGTGGATNGCGTKMRNITAMALVKDMGIGWNLGNTMDAPTETGWGNPVTTQAMIQAIAASGFKAIRIPVTWSGHFGGAPGYVIDAAWLNRVQQIVDWAQAAGLYAIVNMHHDGADPGGWILQAQTNPTGVLAEYKALWAQIAQRFSCYSDKLVFESMNEVGFHSLENNGSPTAAATELLNQINGAFATLVRASGGNNALRYLLIAGYWTDTTRSQGVLMPDSRSILSVHYYSPSSFTFGGTTWGAAAEVNSMKADWAYVKTTYLDKGIPVILGEYGVVTSTDTASRIFWLEYLTKITFDYGIAPIIWDDGGGMSYFNRRTLTWSAGVLEALKRASSGTVYTPVKQ